MPALRSPVLVGRRAELTTALGLVDAAARGRGGALLITGEAGVGKSRLVDEMRERASTTGMTVLVGRSVEGGGTYRAVSEAVARLVRRDPLLAAPELAPHRAALRRLLLGGPATEPLPRSPDPTVMLGEAVLALLAGRGCLLVLEDLHWADPDTVDLVRYLAGAVSDVPVLLTVTARDEVAQPGVHRLAAELTTLALRRLDAAGVDALAAACRPRETFTEQQLQELVVRSDGLPFLVEELLGARPRQLPPSLAALVADRLAALPSTSRPLVVAAAVAGGDPDWRLLAAMTDPGRRDTARRDTARRDTDQSDTARRDTDQSDTARRDTAGQDTAGQDTAGQDTAGRHTDRQDTDRQDTAGRDTPGQDTAGRDTPGQDTAGRHTTGQDTAGRDTPGQDTAGRDTDLPDTDQRHPDLRPDDLRPDEPTDAETAALTALRAAADVGLLVVADGRLRWRHALTRDAVLATLLPPERAAVAARAAAVLDERGDRALAARLYTEAGDRARGAQILVELARADVGRGALRSAAALLAEAGEHAAPADRVLVSTLLGRAAEALEVGEPALARLRGAEHAELCLLLARAAIVAGRWTDARRFVERAGRPDDPRSLTLVADAAYGAGDVAQAERLSRAAIDAVGESDPELLCEALAVLGRCTYGTDPARSDAALRRVAQVAAEHGLVLWRVQALFGLGSQEHTAGDPAPPSLAAARALALEAGLLVYVVQADLLRANGMLLVDGPGAALPLLRDTAERAGRLRLTGLQAMAELFAAADAGLSGDEKAMAGWLASADSRADAPTEVTTLGPMVRALPHLMRHDLPRASALLDDAVPALLAHGSAIPIDHIGLWALVRTAVGDRDVAAREILRRHQRLTALGIHAALGYADAIAAGRAGRTEAATALFTEADATIAHLPWWNRLLRLLALEAAVVDGWGDPVPALRADLAAHEAAGTDQLARTCRDLLRTAGAPTRRRAGPPVAPALRARGVTAREAEVLALVAAGLTNAETAERLFLSRRTVETHVARLLAKTGSADRGELRRWADC